MKHLCWVSCIIRSSGVIPSFWFRWSDTHIARSCQKPSELSLASRVPGDRSAGPLLARGRLAEFQSLQPSTFEVIDFHSIGVGVVINYLRSQCTTVDFDPLFPCFFFEEYLNTMVTAPYSWLLRSHSFGFVLHCIELLRFTIYRRVCHPIPASNIPFLVIRRRLRSSQASASFTTQNYQSQAGTGWWVEDGHRSKQRVRLLGFFVSVRIRIPNL